MEVEVAKREEPQIVAELAQTPDMAVKPTGEAVEIAQVVQTTPLPLPLQGASVQAPIQVSLDVPVAATKLPETASWLVLASRFYPKQVVAASFSPQKLLAANLLEAGS